MVIREKLFVNFIQSGVIVATKYPIESIRFFGTESVSWERNLFHGSKICFMGGGGLPLTHYGFMSEDLMRSN